MTVITPINFKVQTYKRVNQNETGFNSNKFSTLEGKLRKKLFKLHSQAENYVPEYGNDFRPVQIEMNRLNKLQTPGGEYLKYKNALIYIEPIQNKDIPNYKKIRNLSLVAKDLNSNIKDKIIRQGTKEEILKDIKTKEVVQEILNFIKE